MLLSLFCSSYEEVEHRGASFSNLSNTGVADGEWLERSLIGVATDEVLEEQLRVSEIGRVVLEGLSVTSDEGLLKIGSEPDPFLHLFSTEKWLTFLDELISAHLDVLIEEVASKHLLSVLVVDCVGVDEERTHDGFGNELEVLVVH